MTALLRTLASKLALQEIRDRLMCDSRVENIATPENKNNVFVADW
jgi:hypothetical protein